MITIQPESMSTMLGDKGFQLAYSDDETHEMLFFRRHNDELFERVRIDFGTQKEIGDLVCAGIECSIVPGRTGLKGMTEYVCLIECASDPTSGWTTLSNDYDVQKWMQSLVACAPKRAIELAKEVGPRITTETADARRAAEGYFAECRKLGSVKEALDELKSSATVSQLEASRRILSYPVAVIPNAMVVYELAALAISVFSESVEGDSTWLESMDVGSVEDQGLMVQLQFLASKLASEPGW